MSEINAPDRLVSLDVFRGITIAAMVLVNNPGTWSSIYGPLKHAEWHGITPTDYIFPFFLFIVGVAIPIAFARRPREIAKAPQYQKIVVRSAAIFATGLAISALPLLDIGKTAIPAAAKWVAASSIIAALFFLFLRSFRIAMGLIGVWAAVISAFWLAGYEIVPYNFSGMRIPGVLQRIAVCYLAASLIYLHTTWKQQAVIAAALLLGYWLLMIAVPVPGCDVTTIDDKACNLAAWLDRTILTEAHMWRSAKVYDPEGILSTMPAVATTLSGVLAGTWLLTNRKPLQNSEAAVPSRSELEVAAGLFFSGTVLLAVGWIWSLVFPLNKALWTSSYAVYTSGLALLTLGFCYYLIDIKGYRTWAKPFVIFGVNALALFVFSGIMARLLGIIKVAGVDGREMSFQRWLFDNLYLTVASPVNASLLYAISFILLWLFLMWLLYRKGIYIKV